jgi:cobalamin biosynthesis Mg chelatase CobN
MLRRGAPRRLAEAEGSTPGAPKGQARPAPAPSTSAGGLRTGAGGYLSSVTEAGRNDMPMWVWVLIIVLLVLLLLGGVGYGRRGTRV